jgi:hypothetical protein
MVYHLLPIPNSIAAIGKPHTTHTTPASLLERLRRPEEDQAWEQFVALYTLLTPALAH